MSQKTEDRNQESEIPNPVSCPRFETTAKSCRDVACNVSTESDITGLCIPDLV